MQMDEIFYCTFWISAISIVWFCTDWFIHYTQLFNISTKTRESYTLFIKENPDKYFPDFLFALSLKINNRLVKFMCKMASCPFCLMLWMSIVASVICSNVIIAAPIYVLSLFILLQIKRMI